jgi:HTH-type transcriptional regulator, sugar sensing transcriptional regulator
MAKGACMAAGLNANETKVYKSLLTLGKSTVTEISKYGGLERTMLYGILSRLIEKGIVTKSEENGIKRFSPAPPNSLIHLLKVKEEIVEAQLPELEFLYNQNRSDQEVRLYKGKMGVKNLLNELLDENSPWYVIGGTTDIKKVLETYVPQFHRKRKEKKIQFNVLFTKVSSKRADELKLERYTKIKFLPKAFAAPMHVAITGKKVAFNLWAEKPIGILIESEEIASSFRKYFAFLWSLGS